MRDPIEFRGWYCMFQMFEMIFLIKRNKELFIDKKGSPESTNPPGEGGDSIRMSGKVKEFYDLLDEAKFDDGMVLRKLSAGLRDWNEILRQMITLGPAIFDPLFRKFALYPVAGFIVVPLVETVFAPLSRLTILSQVEGATVGQQIDNVFKNHGGNILEWKTIWETIDLILKEQGGDDFSLYDGTSISIVYRLVFYGINVLSYLGFKSQLCDPMPSSEGALIMCGGLAALTATLISHPIDTLRTRILAQTRKNYNKGFWSSFHEICRDDDHGFRSLYAGLLPSLLLSIVPSITTSLFLYRSLRSTWFLLRPNDSLFMKDLVCSSLASLVASTVSFPLKVVQRRMQIKGQEGLNNMDSLRETVEQIVEDEGVGGLYRGIQPHCLKVVGSHVISFFAYELVRVPCCLITMGLCVMFGSYELNLDID